MKYKILLGIITILLSFLISLGFLFPYISFQENRYWNGTIYRVEKNIYKIYNNFSKSKTISYDSLNDNYYIKMFKPLSGKLFIEIFRDNKSIYKNKRSDKKINKYFKDINFGKSVVVRLARYHKPNFYKKIIKWITSPTKIFTYVSDYITLPFLFFFFICLLFTSSFLLFLKSRHEKSIIEDILRELK